MAEVVLGLPSPASVVWALPAAPVVTLIPASVAVDVLPVGFIPYFDPEAVVSASGSGATAVVARASTGAVGSGSGSTIVGPPAVKSAVVASGSGSLDVLGYETSQGIPAAVVATGSGATLVQPRATSPAIASGIGASAVSGIASTSASPSGSGGTAVTATPGAAVNASGAGTGAVAPTVGTRVLAAGAGTMVVTPITFRDMGMKKVSDIAYSNFSAATTAIPGWVAATTERPGSVVTGDALGPASGNAVRTVTVTAQMTSSGGGTASVQVLKNGVLIGSLPLPAGSSAAQTASFANVSIAQGDLFTLSMSYTGSGYSRTLVAAGTLLYFAA